MMKMSKKSLCLAAVVACTGALLVSNAFSADEKTPKAAGSAREKKDAAGKEMTFVGKLVDLQGHMTGQYASDDHAKCTADAIRAGVPAAIITPNGPVVIGQGATGPSKTLVPLAFQRVQVTGKYYEKGGLKYIDISSARATTVDTDPARQSEE